MEGTNGLWMEARTHASRRKPREVGGPGMGGARAGFPGGRGGNIATAGQGLRRAGQDEVEPEEHGVRPEEIRRKGEQHTV
eukprot:2408916-Heterocapsa_arctica.AAC.1